MIVSTIAYDAAGNQIGQLDWDETWDDFNMPPDSELVISIIEQVAMSAIPPGGTPLAGLTDEACMFLLGIARIEHDGRELVVTA